MLRRTLAEAVSEMASVPAEAAKVVIKLRRENIFFVIKSILSCVSEPSLCMVNNSFNPA